MCRAPRLLAGKLRLRARIGQQLRDNPLLHICWEISISISCQISQLLDALPLTKQPDCRLGDFPCTASGRKLHLAGQSQSRVGRLSRGMSVMLASCTAAICSSDQPHASSNIRGLPRTQVGG